MKLDESALKPRKCQLFVTEKICRRSVLDHRSAQAEGGVRKFLANISEYRLLIELKAGRATGGRVSENKLGPDSGRGGVPTRQQPSQGHTIRGPMVACEILAAHIFGLSLVRSAGTR